MVCVLLWEGRGKAKGRSHMPRGWHVAQPRPMTLLPSLPAWVKARRHNSTTAQQPSATIDTASHPLTVQVRDADVWDPPDRVAACITARCVDHSSRLRRSRSL